MLTTALSYRLITSDLDGALRRTAETPQIQRETDHYLARIGDIDSIEQFLSDDRVYQYAMRAHGLEDMIYAKAFMRKVLTEGIDNPDSFANRLNDRRFHAFAEVFNFARYTTATTSFSRTGQGTVDKYVRQSLELDAGQDNEGLRLALYFQRQAPSATTPYALLADRALLKVTQVALGLPESSGALDIDRQAEMISNKLNVADLKDPAKIDHLLQRFVALWEIENPSAGAALASANALLASSNASFDQSLLTSIQTISIASKR